MLNGDTEQWALGSFFNYSRVRAYDDFLLPEKYLLFERFTVFSPCENHKEKKNKISHCKIAKEKKRFGFLLVKISRRILLLV